MEQLIVCGSTNKDFPQYAHECGFTDLIILVNHLVTDLIILSTIFATIGIAVVGFKLMTAGGDEGAMKAAKGSLLAILKGFFFILVAWLLIYTITNTLLDTSYSLLGAPTQ